MNLKLNYRLLKEKIIRLNPIYSKQPIRLSYQQDTRLAFDTNGYIVNAKGLNFIMWSKISEDINKEVIGMHIEKFISLLKENGARSASSQNLENLVNGYYQFGILKKDENKLNIHQKCKILK